MRITKFWAKGYRSLKSVELDNLGDFNVFYGPNGSGKSNVLAAIRTLFDLVGVIAVSGTQQLLAIKPDDAHRRESMRVAGAIMRDTRVLQRRDLRVGDRERLLVFGAVCEAVEAGELVIGERSFREVTVEVEVDWAFEAGPNLGLRRLLLDGVPVDQVQPSVTAGAPYSQLLTLLGEHLARNAFSRVDADRTPREEVTSPPPTEVTNVVAWHLRHGRLKNALFSASTSTSAAMRARLKTYRSLLEGAPLRRPEFDIVHDPRTMELDVRERLGDADVSLDLAGLGIAQIYALLAGVVLAGARAVGVEEPEAHLHAPDAGRDLRGLLQRVVDEKIIDQLFIATHSNLFDLDPKTYWDVSMVDGATVIQRRPLDDVDARHLYEPGPAKHALLRALEYLAPDTVVFRRLSDAAPVTAAAMCDLLRRDAREADDYLDAVYGNAVRSVRRLAQTAAPKSERPA